MHALLESKLVISQLPLHSNPHEEWRQYNGTNSDASDNTTREQAGFTKLLYIAFGDTHGEVLYTAAVSTVRESLQK